jgi:arylsulfatase A-like enzyme
MYRVFFAILFVLLPAAAGADDRPNVLFLFADDQRPDTIAALGNDVIKTPNLDRIANNGFVFNNAYCMGATMGAVCNPSRHQVMSGMSLFRYKNADPKSTWGAVMRAAGYTTWHVSKNGNTAKVAHKEFEHSSYLNDSQARTGGEQGKDAADRAITFLDNGWNQEKPLFMYIGFAGPHDPRGAGKWADLYKREEIPLPLNYKPFHPFDNGEMVVRDEKLELWPRTEDAVRQHIHDYYGCISSIDANIGRVLAKLEEQGELENTVVIFSADHGLAVGSHGLFGKQSVYEHSMGAPMMFMGPGIEKGRSEAFAYLYDLFPTACDFAGVDAPTGLDGKSLAPVIRSESEAVRDTVFLAYRDVQRAVRRGDWKLIRYPKVDVTQLFHLSKDPDELTNLAENPEYAAKVEEMMALLTEQQAEFDDKVPLIVENPKPAKVTVESLTALAAAEAKRPKKPRQPKAK